MRSHAAFVLAVLLLSACHSAKGGPAPRTAVKIVKLDHLGELSLETLELQAESIATLTNFTYDYVTGDERRIIERPEHDSEATFQDALASRASICGEDKDKALEAFLAQDCRIVSPEHPELPGQIDTMLELSGGKLLIFEANEHAVLMRGAFSRGRYEVADAEKARMKELADTASSLRAMGCHVPFDIASRQDFGAPC